MLATLSRERVRRADELLVERAAEARLSRPSATCISLFYSE